MALKYLVDLDLGQNELQNAVLQNVPSPSGGVAGQIVYDTAAGAVFVSNGTSYSRVGLTADGSTITDAGGTISVGSIAISKVTGLQTELNSKLEAADLSGYATETYVTTAIGNVIDSAPAALDTLNELAEALGDDPNFAGTITTELTNLSEAIDLKLDASAYTAADVLAKLLTVDGAGSGLDADTLDGFPSQYFIDYTNFVNTPTFGALASLDSVGSAQINDNSVRAAELAVSGNGTSGQFLRSDGDGTFTWATPTDTNTQLSKETVQDYVGEMVSGNTETGIAVSYNDSGNKINFVNQYASVTDNISGTGGFVAVPSSGAIDQTSVMVQVKQIVGGDFQFVMTDWYSDGGQVYAYLPGGADYFVSCSGIRA